MSSTETQNSHSTVQEIGPAVLSELNDCGIKNSSFRCAKGKEAICKSKTDYLVDYFDSAQEPLLMTLASSYNELRSQENRKRLAKILGRERNV